MSKQDRPSGKQIMGQNRPPTDKELTDTVDQACQSLETWVASIVNVYNCPSDKVQKALRTIYGANKLITDRLAELTSNQYVKPTEKKETPSTSKD